MKIITFQGVIYQIKTKVDRTVEMILHSSLELNDPKELAAIFSLKKNDVTLAIKQGNFTDAELADVPEPNPEFKGEKSPGQRMRAVIFKVWEMRGKKGQFELFYRASMESMIKQWKEKLN